MLFTASHSPLHLSLTLLHISLIESSANHRRPPSAPLLSSCFAVCPMLRFECLTSLDSLFDCCVIPVHLVQGACFAPETGLASEVLLGHRLAIVLQRLTARLSRLPCLTLT
jgi:hypothetical protein